MLVRHPKYGLGRIVALSGSGPSRKATVDFASAAGRKKFVLERKPAAAGEGQLMSFGRKRTGSARA